MTDIFQFGSVQIRTAGTPEDPLFCAADVCEALEISNASQACARLDQDEQELVSLEHISGRKHAIFVTEPGLYRLIGGSNKEQARQFSRWLNHEVLPSIRRTGAYSIKPPTCAEQLLANAQLLVQIERAQAEHERRLANVEATQAKAAAEVSEALALPPATADASERTQGQMAVALLKARLEFAKRNKERGKQAKRLCDIIDESGKSELVYAIARQLFVRSEAVGS